MHARGNSDPRTLLVDYETFPMLFYAWQAWEASALRIVEDTAICSFSAKWLGGKQITRALCDYRGYRPGSRDDRKLMDDLWPLLIKAERVVAHNLDGFDDKKANFRFMIHGIAPPSPYQHIDTLKEVRKVSGHDSNKLNELCRVHGIGQKVKTGGQDLWFDCLGGDTRAWARMKKYNAHDVRLLEPVYLLLRPWMKTHPNVAANDERPCCPKCGSSRMHRDGYTTTRDGRYVAYECQSCGGWARDAKAESRAVLRNA